MSKRLHCASVFAVFAILLHRGARAGRGIRAGAGPVVFRVDGVAQRAPDDAGLEQQHGTDVRQTYGFGNVGASEAGKHARADAVSFSSAFIGVADSGASLVAGSNKRLTFAGRTNLTIAPGEGAWSDPVVMEVKAFQRLAVSLDVSSASDISTHTLGLVTNYTAQGSHAADVSGSGFTAVPPGGNVPGYPFYWLAKVDVMSSAASGTIVAFGDSITDGRCSTNRGRQRHSRSIPALDRRAGDAPRVALPAGEIKGIVNEGIAGNRIAPLAETVLQGSSD